MLVSVVLSAIIVRAVEYGSRETAAEAQRRLWHSPGVMAATA